MDEDKKSRGVPRAVMVALALLVGIILLVWVMAAMSTPEGVPSAPGPLGETTSPAPTV